MSFVDRILLVWEHHLALPAAIGVGAGVALRCELLEMLRGDGRVHPRVVDVQPGDVGVGVAPDAPQFDSTVDGLRGRRARGRRHRRDRADKGRVGEPRIVEGCTHKEAVISCRADDLRAVRREHRRPDRGARTRARAHGRIDRFGHGCRGGRLGAGQCHRRARRQGQRRGRNGDDREGQRRAERGARVRHGLSVFVGRPDSRYFSYRTTFTSAIRHSSVDRHPSVASVVAVSPRRSRLVLVIR